MPVTPPLMDNDDCVGILKFNNSPAILLSLAVITVSD